MSEGSFVHILTQELLDDLIELWQLAGEEMPYVARTGDRSLERMAFFLWERNTIALQTPRRCGKTTAAIKAAARRGGYAYLMSNAFAARSVECKIGSLTEGGVFASPATVHHHICDNDEIRTVIYDEVYASAVTYRKMFERWAERAKRIGQPVEDILIIRLG